MKVQDELLVICGCTHERLFVKALVMSQCGKNAHVNKGGNQSQKFFFNHHRNNLMVSQHILTAVELCLYETCSSSHRHSE